MEKIADAECGFLIEDVGIVPGDFTAPRLLSSRKAVEIIADDLIVVSAFKFLRRGSQMNPLVSVNVGLPRDVEWQGRVVRTAIWKRPVTGRVHVRRLNIDGDGQGDLAGHGGEHRALMVYQLESYRYWENFLERHDLEYGHFGENLTVDGLPDNEVCIGDRYRIGSALFEVTQPRVTCYRVGIRMNNPQCPLCLSPIDGRDSTFE